jgi:hypothetical protein
VAINKESESRYSGKEKIVSSLIVPIVIVGLTLFVRESQKATDALLDKNLKAEAMILQEKGLLGEQPIIDLRDVPGEQAPAGFINTMGSFHGEIVEKLKFAWKPNGDGSVQTSEVPTKNIKYFVLDDPNVQPTVQFTGMKPELFVRMLNSSCIFNENSDNLNDYVDKAAEQITIFTLSKADWEKFRGAPGK